MKLGALTVYPYGLCVAVSAALCLLFGRARLRARGLGEETAGAFAVWCLPLAFLFSRMGYCLVCADGFTRQGIAYFFDFTAGGYTLWGALLGGCLALLPAARRTGRPAMEIADALAAPAALMIALCRLAEGLTGQGYGWYVEDWFDPDLSMSLLHPQEYDALLRFPFAMQDMYGEWCWAIYVLEALLALGVCLLLLRARGRRAGSEFERALAMLAAAQILCESLRQDAVLRFGFVRVSQLCAALVIALLIVRRALILRERKRIIAASLVACAMIGVVVAMEFALEKKIVLLEALPMDVCYMITAAACAGLAASALSLE